MDTHTSGGLVACLARWVVAIATICDNPTGGRWIDIWCIHVMNRGAPNFRVTPHFRRLDPLVSPPSSCLLRVNHAHTLHERCTKCFCSSIDGGASGSFRFCCTSTSFDKLIVEDGLAVQGTHR